MKSRNFISVMAVAASLSAMQAHAAEDEESLVAAEVAKMFEVETRATRLDSEAIRKVTDAAIYDAEVEVTGPEGGSTSKIRVMKLGGKVSALETPSTDQGCPWLKEMIKKDFRLKTDEDVKTLEAALDKIYPISDIFGEKDRKAKAIRRKDGMVVFIRGVFFKDLKGFVFETDGDGSIVKVSYSLSLKHE